MNLQIGLKSFELSYIYIYITCITHYKVRSCWYSYKPFFHECSMVMKDIKFLSYSLANYSYGWLGTNLQIHLHVKLVNVAFYSKHHSLLRLSNNYLDYKKLWEFFICFYRYKKRIIGGENPQVEKENDHKIKFWQFWIYFFYFTWSMIFLLIAFIPIGGAATSIYYYVSRCALQDDEMGGSWQDI